MRIGGLGRLRARLVAVRPAWARAARVAAHRRTRRRPRRRPPGSPAGSLARGRRCDAGHRQGRQHRGDTPARRVVAWRSGFSAAARRARWRRRGVTARVGALCDLVAVRLLAPRRALLLLLRAPLDQLFHRRHAALVVAQRLARLFEARAGQLHGRALLRDGLLEALHETLVALHQRHAARLAEARAPALDVFAAVGMQLLGLRIGCAGRALGVAQPEQGGVAHAAFVIEQLDQGLHGGHRRAWKNSGVQWPSSARRSRQLSASVARSCMSCCSSVASGRCRRTAASSSASRPSA